ncbi:MAG: nitrogenase-stabilizing/protective protein NifW [Chromatiales bacterium]|jgi:nitrogenase-stabilizing/protective protein
MSETELELDMDELSSAEDFLEYFDISYDAAVVHVNRLHILQRFHDYLADVPDMPTDEDKQRELYAGLLNSAYNDFVSSDAQTEKVFKVFKMNEPVQVAIPLTDLMPQVTSGAPEV